MAHGKHKRNGTAHAKRNGTPPPVAADLAADSPSSEAAQPSTLDRSSALSTAVPVKTSAEGESLNKIRDILFGQQVQTHDQRFEKLERRVSDDYDHLKTDLIGRLEALERRLEEHLDRLGQRLREEETDRKTAVVQVEEKLSAVNQDIQADIKHQTLTLKDALDQQVYDVLTDLEKEKKARQQSTRAERAQLSTLFSELSSQLADDPAGDLANEQTDELADDT